MVSGGQSVSPTAPKPLRFFAINAPAKFRLGRTSGRKFLFLVSFGSGRDS